MTKEQLTELTTEHLIKLDKNSVLHPEIASKLITMAMNQILYDTFRRVPTELDLMAKEFTIDLTDGSAELPVSVYQLPEMAQVRRISLVDDNYLPIVPQPVSSIPMYNLLDVGLIDTTISFSLTGKTLTLYNLPSGTTQVKAWLIPTFDTLEDDDEVYIPSGKNIDFYTIIEQIYQSVQPPNLLNQ